MASTPSGIAFQEYLNSELRRLALAASATVEEGQDNFDFGVHIRGVVSDHVIVKGAYLNGIDQTTREMIAERLNRLSIPKSTDQS